MKEKGIALAVSSALIFGAAPVFASLSYDYGNIPLNMALFRNLMALPVLLGVIIYKRLSLRLTRRQLKGMIVISILGSAVTTISLYQAYSYIGVGTTTTIHFMYPLLVCLGCHFFYGEKMDRVRKICLGVCLAGITFFIEPQNMTNAAGLVLAAGSAFSYAFFMIFLEKNQLVWMHPIVFSFYLCLIVSAFLLFIGFFVPFVQWKLEIQAYGLMFIAAMGTSFAASVLLNKGVAIIGASEASVYSLLEPLSAVAAGAIFLGEELTARKAAGCALILGAVFYMAIYEKRRKREVIGKADRLQ